MAIHEPTVVGSQRKSALYNFVSKIRVKENGCWIWSGAINSSGYGHIRYDGSDLLAHRVSYETFRNKIPDDKQMDHLCRVRSCVNPFHLEPVTQQENIVRSQKARTHCKHGHPLTSDNVTKWRKGKYICRKCLTCANGRSAASNAKRKSKVQT